MATRLEDQLLTGYHAARDSVGVVERDDLVQLRMWGRDPVRMLNGLSTSDMTTGSASQAVYGAMLSPKGRMLTDLRVFPGPGEGDAEILIALPVAAIEEVSAHLKKYVPPLFARWGEADRSVIGVYGPRSGDVVTDVVGAKPIDREDALAWGSYQGAAVAVVATRMTGSEGYDLFSPSDRAEELTVELRRAAEGEGGGAVPFAAFDLLRIEAGRPRYGVDMTDETLPAEAFESIGQMDRAVSFTKGCYTGQEVVIRIAHRGHVNRHLRGLLLGGSAPPVGRVSIYHGETGKEIGWTTSAVESPLMGETIALGFLRREVSIGDGVSVGPEGAPATVAGLPFARR